MKRKVLIIGSIAAATVLAGGWALAQTGGFGPGGFGPPFMQGHGGPGMMMQHKGGMGPGMGKGMMQHEGMQHQGGAIGPGMMGPGMMQGGAGQFPFDPTRLATLKTELGITAAQETAWTKYTTAVRDAATAMGTTRADIDPNTVRNMTPQDRFAFVTKIREQAQARFTAVQTAANELLAGLDDTQKAKARDILPGLAFGPGRAASVNQQQHQH
jgi:LTXXQ motif family protein